MRFEIDVERESTSLRIIAQPDENPVACVRAAIKALEAEMEDFHRCPFHAGHESVSLWENNL